MTIFYLRVTQSHKPHKSTEQKITLNVQIFPQIPTSCSQFFPTNKNHFSSGINENKFVSIQLSHSKKYECLRKKIMNSQQG